MTIVNIMWSDGEAYASVHKVHNQILSWCAGSEFESWILIEGASPCCKERGQIKRWNFSSRQIRGRNFWSLLRSSVRDKLRRRLAEIQASLLLLDGIGVARLVVPLVETLPGAQAVVMFHGRCRLKPSDVTLLSSRHVQIVAVSEALATWLREELNRPVLAQRFAHNPQQYRASLLVKEEARQALGYHFHDRFLFGAIGRLASEKGFDLVISALGKLPVSTPPWHLLILGEGAERVNLEALCVRYGVQDHVSFAGHRPDAEQLYKAFDTLLIPSRQEGLGLVLQEAILSGIPVICSDLSVFREQLKASGLYVSTGDSEAWSRAITSVFNYNLSSVATSQYESLDPDLSWNSFRDGFKQILQT
ncbi:MAG TPA: glycosyltransferase [Pseudomonas xinjiangensis]|uniref:Glycosyltransferase n=2 Tax=root TaxID=1 RepID=A0A7V1BPI6_9GAMM|nr:glycosyltransferase [Halopseudomonas xinjiangensis]HEC49496.1 glycosyltransferase [Halopseudomonas xinjiangensis]